MNLSKENNILTIKMPSVLQILMCPAKVSSPSDSCPASVEKISRRLERAESKCRIDDDHDLWYKPGPPAKFRRISVRGLSHWSGQQQHLLQRLQALGLQ